MIHSMTAFARRESQGDWGTLTLELRSVNHRYLDMNLRLADEVRMLEPRLRERIGQRLARGKLDCTLRYQMPMAQSSLALDGNLAKRLAQLADEVSEMLKNPAPNGAFELLRWPGVMQLPTADPERLHAEALHLLDAALDELVETRRREGDALQALLLQRCTAMEAIITELAAYRPAVLQRGRERLHERLAELKAELDTLRLEQELVLLAQRLDVEEELDRLKAHLDEVRRVLQQREPVGRRLDFLMQELNREANTLSSKSQDIGTTRHAVDLKVLIEQMREQIQNIE